MRSWTTPWRWPVTSPSDTMPGEQAFLNALTGVGRRGRRGSAFVVVMIRSDLDEQGYDERARSSASYLAQRLERNGTTVSVNEPQDFGAIIRRRIFARPDARPADRRLWPSAGPTAATCALA